MQSTSTLESFIPLIEAGKTVRLIPKGGSMVPFITGDRDIIELHSIDGAVKKGDIILYRRNTGMLVLHRVYRVDGNDYYMLGDGQTQIEGPISRTQFVAKCDIYYKKGVRKDNNSKAMKIKYSIWFVLLPLRPYLIRANSKIKGI